MQNFPLCQANGCDAPQSKAVFLLEYKPAYIKETVQHKYTVYTVHHTVMTKALKQFGNTISVNYISPLIIPIGV